MYNVAHYSYKILEGSTVEPLNKDTFWDHLAVFLCREVVIFYRMCIHEYF